MLVLKKPYYPEKVDDSSLYALIYLEQHGITGKKKVFRVRRSGFFVDIESESEGHSVVSDCLQPHTVHGILKDIILEWVAFPFSRGSSQPRIKPRSPTLQADSLRAEPQGKPKNTGVGSLSLLQHIFPTQELNQGLLYCRRILYQLSYKGSPL